jgi:hypothetical protein
MEDVTVGWFNSEFTFSILYYVRLDDKNFMAN